MGATTTSAFDLDIPVLDLGRRGRPASASAATLRAAAERELDRPQPVRVLDPALRRRRRDAARQAVAQRGVEDHGDAGHHRPGSTSQRQRTSILSAEGDEHTRLRRLVGKAFSPRAADRLRPFMREVDRRARRRGGADRAGRRRRRHLRAVPDPDHLRAARRAEGGLEAVQPLGRPTCCASSTATSPRTCRSIVAAQDELDEYTRELIADRRDAARPTTCSPTSSPPRRPATSCPPRSW